MASVRRALAVLLSIVLVVPYGTPVQARDSRGRLVCESVGSDYQYCPADTDRRVRLVRQLSKAPCREGDSWGYDKRGIWVDRGCRAEFAYGKRGRDDDDDGLSDTQKAALAAAGIIGAIALGSAIANHNNTGGDEPPVAIAQGNADRLESRESAYRQGYRYGRSDDYERLGRNYRRYGKVYNRSGYEYDFQRGYDDGYNGRPSRY